MAPKQRPTESQWIEPDDVPQLDRDWLGRAEIRDGDTLVRRGRPKSAAPKESINIRFDHEVLAHYRAKGSGWQSRINADLRKAARLRARP